MIHNFTGANGDGAYPLGDKLVFETAGNLLAHPPSVEPTAAIVAAASAI